MKESQETEIAITEMHVFIMPLPLKVHSNAKKEYFKRS